MLGLPIPSASGRTPTILKPILIQKLEGCFFCSFKFSYSIRTVAVQICCRQICRLCFIARTSPNSNCAGFICYFTNILYQQFTNIAPLILTVYRYWMNFPHMIVSNYAYSAYSMPPYRLSLPYLHAR